VIMAEWDNSAVQTTVATMDEPEEA